jgi:hypothetical protein
VERLRWVLRQQREHFLPLKVIRDRLADGDLGDRCTWSPMPVARPRVSRSRRARPALAALAGLHLLRSPRTRVNVRVGLQSQARRVRPETHVPRSTLRRPRVPVAPRVGVTAARAAQPLPRALQPVPLSVLGLAQCHVARNIGPREGHRPIPARQPAVRQKKRAREQDQPLQPLQPLRPVRPARPARPAGQRAQPSRSSRRTWSPAPA